MKRAYPALAILASLAGLLVASSAKQGGGPALVDVALSSAGARATATSQYSDKHAGALATDGTMDQGTGCWYSADWSKLPVTLTIELPRAERVLQARLWQARWTGSMYHTRGFHMEASQDGSTWQPVGSGELQDDNGSHAEISLDVKARWFRVVIDTSYIPFQTCGLAEVELMADRPAGVGRPDLRLNGRGTWVSDFCGLRISAAEAGPQVAVSREEGLLCSVRKGEDVRLAVPVTARQGGWSLRADVACLGGKARVAVGGDERTVVGGTAAALGAATGAAGESISIVRVVGVEGDAVVRLRGLHLRAEGEVIEVPMAPPVDEAGRGIVPVTPQLRPAIQRAMLIWDWRMADGIGVGRTPVSYRDAAIRVAKRGEHLLAHVPAAQREALERAWRSAAGQAASKAGDGSAAWLRIHELRRRMMLADPRTQIGRLAFIKQAPGVFSHQLTQVYGRYARPGGGVFVLDRPGVDLSARQLGKGALPVGSYAGSEASWDGKRLLFAFCQVKESPADTIQGQRPRNYNLYTMLADGTGVKQVTYGAWDDFSPRYMPDGRIVFISTRRGGWHRCGTPGCENYTLAVCGPGGQDPHPISFHETQEWDPAILNDGRIAYTRWDYVDRHPVFYEHLWTTHPDGTEPAALFGNKTFNPVGIWETRAIPGSRKVMATAAAHHAMTAGSIILVDTGRGGDGPAPVQRLTPDAPFPESETRVSGTWFAPMAGTKPYESEESTRWPNHVYRSPYPLGEDLFIAAYSYQGLVGEPRANLASMFGLYLCDKWGNRELLHRDPSISSLWPMPLRPRHVPPVISPRLDPRMGDRGLVVLQDIYQSLPKIERGAVKSLRVVQVLPKATPGKDMPSMGLASGAPGKQILGTVPVESDGSAAFWVPARKEIAFQALDANGVSVQIMRSGTYLQPGERVTCVGCHEKRTQAPPARSPIALRRSPSVIAPGPDGSRPFSYAILVQPVLDRNCVSCHGAVRPSGGVNLTGTPEGRYTASYNSLAPRVPTSDMGNAEALSTPRRFGSGASPVMQMLLTGHHGVKLARADIERISTWMDASALFYGTFDTSRQLVQQNGGRIKAPDIE